MARIVGIDLPNNKRIDIALTYIYGIGHKSAKQILHKCNIDSAAKVYTLSTKNINDLRTTIESEFNNIEGNLRREVSINIKRLIDLGNYRGVRHRKGLPTRGQRTKTNARTRKGPKKSIVRNK